MFRATLLRLTTPLLRISLEHPPNSRTHQLSTTSRGILLTLGVENQAHYPPLAAGSMTIAPRKEDHVSVSTACLELSEIAAIVADPRAGAISTFSGTTRDNHFGESSRRIEGVVKGRGLRCRSCAELTTYYAGLEPCSRGCGVYRFFLSAPWAR